MKAEFWKNTFLGERTFQGSFWNVFVQNFHGGWILEKIAKTYNLKRVFWRNTLFLENLLEPVQMKKYISWRKNLSRPFLEMYLSKSIREKYFLQICHSNFPAFHFSKTRPSVEQAKLCPVGGTDTSSIFSPKPIFNAVLSPIVKIHPICSEEIQIDRFLTCQHLMFESALVIWNCVRCKRGWKSTKHADK